MREYMEWFRGFVSNLFALFMGGLVIAALLFPCFLH